MERIYWIVGTILAIIGVLGFIIRILISSPPWLPDVSIAMGIVGLVGSWLTFFTGASSGQLAGFREEMGRFRMEMIAFRGEMGEFRKEMIAFRREMTGFMTGFRREMSEFRKEVVSLLKEIRDLLRR
jgi:hypothetical protein